MKTVPFMMLTTWPGVTRLDVFYPGLVTAPLKRTSTRNECLAKMCDV